MGKSFNINYKPEFEKLYQDSSPNTPIIFILSSSGINPFIEIENYGKRLGFSVAQRNLHYVSMGQGQEKLIEKSIQIASKYGHWLILQNLHLIPDWLSSFDKLISFHSLKAHDNMRLFISLEVNESSKTQIMFINNILESSIKVTNETPNGNERRKVFSL
jgi:dynein heavy chain